jgi:hypothetical protein
VKIREKIEEINNRILLFAEEKLVFYKTAKKRES